MLGFQVDKKINESILLRKWPRNASNVKDNAYETHKFAYNKELDILVLVNKLLKTMWKRRAPHHT